MAGDLWQRCLERLEDELSAQQFNTWIRPLQAAVSGRELRLLAPNRFVLDWVKKRLVERIETIARNIEGEDLVVVLEVGGMVAEPTPAQRSAVVVSKQEGRPSSFGVRLNPDYTFETHVEGKSNQLGRAAARQVGENPGGAYNPLFIYGGSGLGKTHLMQAAGHVMVERRPGSRVAYVRSEEFVGDMVRALRHNTINEFKKQYRTLDALLIDDIQFFAEKTHSQEEFFHTFNALLDGQKQVIITSDRFPKELGGVEERLISRFGSGLTVSLEPPELETRVAILMRKARLENIELREEVAFFIAKRVRSNVRELEGALRKVLATASFMGRKIDLDLVAESLKDLVAFQERLVTVNNIQKIVAEYFKIRVADLHAKDRSRKVARPRQMAMALAKELTNQSLPEIGDAFGGRDHTTVLHACRKIEELRQAESQAREDYSNLLRILGS